ncbi:MAG: leucyl aminopeptidase [Gammaproteobacteria bacterium]|nr:leucyl aminopeptidase [Gammaproteobacteria bacterium]
MKFDATSGSPQKTRAACAVVGVFEARRMSEPAQRFDTTSRGAIGKLMRRGDVDGRHGHCVMLHTVPGVAAERLLVVGCGRERDFNERRYREVLARSTRQLQEAGVADALSYLPLLEVPQRDSYWKIRQAVEITGDTLYAFDELKTKKKKPGPRELRKVTFGLLEPGEQAQAERAIADGESVAAGAKLARDLANRPANYCTPTYLAEQARLLGRQFPAIRTTVIDAARMKKLGMGALLAVARGSREPPKLIIMEYRGPADGRAPYALVGKGVTFDSGGISIKPAAAMDEMKFDMSGAASVFGTLLAVARMKLPLHLVALVPATENLPGGNAIKPGDVVTSLSGQTIEILNTDAEGRLILCDALTYAARYEPEAVIDVATLTGACVVALGKHASGLFSNHQPLADALLTAGQVSGDRAWQLPLWDEYQNQLDTNFADMANVGGREAGSITAACFLARFTKKLNWAHLDIAGTAYRTGKEKGATGRPVPLLVEFLRARCA